MHTDTGKLDFMYFDSMSEDSKQRYKRMINETTDPRPRMSDEQSKMVEVFDDELKPLSAMTNFQRKNYMRNKPCVCGSGKKFKRCCWGKFL